MKSPKQLAIVILGFLCASRVCFGIPHLNVPQLVRDSTLIVVADVGDIKAVGPAQVIFNGAVLPGQNYRAEAVALYTLMGNSPGRFTIEFAVPIVDNGYGSVRSGIRMLFLKGSGAVYNPANPYYPDLPALASPPPETEGKTAAEKILAELRAVVASPDASPVDRRDVLLWSYVIPDDDKLFLSGVRTGIQNTSDPDLHWRLEAELIKRNDVSRFTDVCDALLSGTLPEDQQRTVLYSIASRLSNEKALPELKRLLKSSNPEVRAASTQSLWHIASPASVGALVEALHDGNPDVRYYAIRGLADITGEPQWGPGPGEYEGHETKYLQHWLGWASQHPAPHTDN